MGENLAPALAVSFVSFGRLCEPGCGESDASVSQTGMHSEKETRKAMPTLVEWTPELLLSRTLPGGQTPPHCHGPGRLPGLQGVQQPASVGVRGEDRQGAHTAAEVRHGAGGGAAAPGAERGDAENPPRKKLCLHKNDLKLK